MTLLVIVVGGAQTVVARGICQREIGQLQGGFGMLRPAVHPYPSPHHQRTGPNTSDDSACCASKVPALVVNSMACAALFNSPARMP